MQEYPILHILYFIFLLLCKTKTWIIIIYSCILFKLDNCSINCKFTTWNCYLTKARTFRSDTSDCHDFWFTHFYTNHPELPYDGNQKIWISQRLLSELCKLENLENIYHRNTSNATDSPRVCPTWTLSIHCHDWKWGVAFIQPARKARGPEGPARWER